MFAVTSQAQDFGDDHELRRTPGARAFHRRLDDFETLGEISAVNL